MKRMGLLAGERCDLCGGVLEARIVDMEFKQNGERVVCESIPADVCVECGEEYLSLQVLQEIEAFLDRRHQERPKQYIPVPVYDLEPVLA